MIECGTGLPASAARSLPTQTMSDEPNPNPNTLNPPIAAATFDSVPQPSEAFRMVPNVSEPFRTVPHSSARSENHTLTVREVARLFEAANVARSERSVVNWCQPNRQGIARLDAYFDPNERRYFITPQSVEAVIAEEKARAAKANAEPPPQGAEGFGKDAESFRNARKPEDATPEKSSDADLAELRKENLDLKIANRAKDYFVEQLQKEREGLLQQVVDSSRRVGQLETKLSRLETGRPDGNQRTGIDAQ